MNIQRESIVDACHSALQTLPSVRAAFLAGSEAFGRQDKYSDIDLSCVAPMADADAIFAAVEANLTRMSPIALKLVMPQSGLWPELTQRFYRLRDTDEFLMIDFCQMTPKQLQTFLEPTRHGTPVVLFDRDGLIKPGPMDADHGARMNKRLEWLRASFPMFQNLVRKAVLRDDLVEAIAMYQGQTMRPLVDLLRIRHNPARFDYGLRYTAYDLPAAVVAELNELMWPRDGRDLLRKLDRAKARFDETITQLR
jgi:hypothetical protein